MVSARLQFLRLCFPFTFLVLLSCSIESDQPGSNGLNQEMKDVRKTATELFLYIWAGNNSDAQESSYSDTEQKNILKLVSDLKGNFHRIEEINDPRTKELGFVNILNLQNNLLSEIESNLQSGKVDYALWQLKGVTHNCFFCHSRLPADQDLISQKISLEGSSFETRLAEAEFLVASRQFSSAEEKLLSLAYDVSSNLSGQASALKAIKLWLLLQIRVKNNLNQSSLDLAKLSLDGKFSFENIELLKHWISELKMLQVETSQIDPKNTTILGRLQYASKKLGKLKESLTEQESDYELVNTVYITSFLHQMLIDHSDKERSQEVLALLGIAYSRLTIPSLRVLSQAYFSECIAAVPHAKWSKICFGHYKDNFDFYHTGSGGYQASADDQDRLERLRLLAK